MFNYFKRNETLLLLCGLGALELMAMGLVSPILPQYARSFGVNITMVGLLITAFGVARLVTDIPVGRLVERFGRRPTLIAGPLILAAGSIACGLAGNYWQLLAFRFVQGIGSATYTTTAMIMLADISTPANRGRVMSLYQGAHFLGAGLGPVVGGLTAQYFGLRAPFFVFAFLASVTALWGYLRLPETRSALAAAPTGGAEPASSSATSETSPKPVLRDLNFILISTVAFGLFFMRQGARNQLLPLLATDRLGMSVGQIGMALTIISIIDFITLFISGRLSDRFGRKMVITPGCLLSALSLVMLSQTYSQGFLLLTCVVWGIGAGVSGPTPTAYAADILTRGNYSSGMAVYRAFGDLGVVVGPILLGWLADVKGYSFPLLFTSVLLFLTVSLFQILAREPSRHGKKAIRA